MNIAKLQGVSFILKVEYLVSISLFTSGWVMGAYGVDIWVYLQAINLNLIASLLAIIGSVATVVGIGFAYTQWRRSRIDDIQSRLAQISVDRVKNAFENSCYVDGINSEINEIGKLKFKATEMVLGHQGTIYVEKLVNLKKSKNAKIIKSKWVCSQRKSFNPMPGWDKDVSQIMNEIIELIRNIDKSPPD